MTAKRYFSPQDYRAHQALEQVVGGLDAATVEEQPQRRLHRHLRDQLAASCCKKQFLTPVVRANLTMHAEARERFRLELKAARLSHPNIVAARDADQAGDVHFLVMEA